MATTAYRKSQFVRVSSLCNAWWDRTIYYWVIKPTNQRTNERTNELHDDGGGGVVVSRLTVASPVKVRRRHDTALSKAALNALLFVGRKDKKVRFATGKGRQITTDEGPVTAILVALFRWHPGLPVKVWTIGRQIDRVRVPGVLTPFAVAPVVVPGGRQSHVVQVPGFGHVKGKVIVCACQCVNCVYVSCMGEICVVAQCYPTRTKRMIKNSNNK